MPTHPKKLTSPIAVPAILEGTSERIVRSALIDTPPEKSPNPAARI
jgi:hypothetical protein